MPPGLATIGFAVLVAALFIFDREKDSQASKTLWIPVVWVSLAASRSVSYWLGFGSAISTVDEALEGEPLNRSIQLALMFAGVIVLRGRSQEVRALLRANRPIVIFFSYCLLSVIWSDYPIVSSKRWIKDLGDLIMVLIVLTERDRLNAVRQLLARFGYALVPLSILLIKYYPALGNAWTRVGDVVLHNGVATDKNMLGGICLIAGLGCVWRLVDAFHIPKISRKTGPLIAQLVLLTMVLWLFSKVNSMTSLACFAFASAAMVATCSQAFSRHRVFVHMLVVSEVLVAFGVLFLDLGGAALKGGLGRDSTLTGRTELWANVLAIHQHSWFGTGHESFWLGERLARLWELHWWRPNEAHNGYLEIYLNLGWIGVALLILLIITGYRNVIAALRENRTIGVLGLAFFIAQIVYGFTEAAFRVMMPLRFFFLLAIIWSSQTTVTKSSTRTNTAFLPTEQETFSPNRG
jgi:exopolysaccharide production protein ExoQ